MNKKFTFVVLVLAFLLVSCGQVVSNPQDRSATVIHPAMASSALFGEKVLPLSEGDKVNVAYELEGHYMILVQINQKDTIVPFWVDKDDVVLDD